MNCQEQIAATKKLVPFLTSALLLFTPINSHAWNWATTHFDKLSLKATDCSVTDTGSVIIYSTSTTAPTQSEISGASCVQVAQSTLKDVSLTTVLYNYGTTTGVNIQSGAREEIWGRDRDHTLGMSYEPNETLRQRSYSVTIQNGGEQFLSTNAIADGATVFGTQSIEGTVRNSTIKNGGAQILYSPTHRNLAPPATAYTTTIESGGSQELISIADTTSDKYVYPTGMSGNRSTAVNTTIKKGGIQRIRSGQANSTTIAGLQEVSSFQTFERYNVPDPKRPSIQATRTVTRLGYANDSTVQDGGTQTIFDGGTANTTTIEWGGIQKIQQQGTAYTTTVQSGGTQSIVIGGTANFSTIQGYQLIDGGTANTNTVTIGGVQYIQNGGVANTNTIELGATQTVATGGTANFSTIQGYQLIDGGTANTNTVTTGGVQYIQNGGVANTNTIELGATQTVATGGIANFSTIQGYQLIDGGTANTNTVTTGATQYIKNGGVANTNTIELGATQTVATGGIANLSTIQGYQLIDGGTANTNTVTTGATQYIKNGGVANTNTIELGATQTVATGGTANLSTIQGYQLIDGGTANTNTVTTGATQYIKNGGVANTNTIELGATQTVATGGIANLSTIQGYQLIDGGTANTNTVTTGATQYIKNGGVANTNTIELGATQTVATGGTANFSTIQGYQLIDGGGSDRATIKSGATQSIINYGQAYNTALDSQAVQTIAKNGRAYLTNIGSGATQTVEATGHAYSSTIANGGEQVILGGGLATGSMIESGSTQTVAAGSTASLGYVSGYQEIKGAAKDVTVKKGGWQSVLANGAADNTTIEWGGTQTIAAGTTASLGYVSGYQEIKGAAKDVTVKKGGWQSVLANGAADNTTIEWGGTQTIVAGSTASLGYVSGYQEIKGGAKDVTVKKGGWQSVLANGAADNTTIEWGGTQTIAAGTTASLGYVSGYQEIKGAAKDVTVKKGGWQSVLANGAADNTTIEWGGTQTIAAGSTASLGYVRGYQEIKGVAKDVTIRINGVQAVLGDGVAYGGTVTIGGEQFIANGGKAYDTQVDLGATQTIAKGGTAYSPTIANGGVQKILDGGQAYNTMLGATATQIVEAGGFAKDTILSNGAVQKVSGTLEHSEIPKGGKVEVVAGGFATGNIIADGEFIFNTANTDTRTYAGVMSGSGAFTKDGGGTLIFNSVSPKFTGTTSVTGGILKLGDMYTPGAQLGGNIQVNSLGTLRGHGTVLGSVINQGTVMPGGSIGTLRIAGDYTQASNGKLVIEMSPTKVAKLKISGTANIDGGLTVVYAPGRYQTGEYNILSADKGVNGKFVNPDYNIPVGHESDDLEQDLLYSNNDVNVVLSKKQELDNPDKDPKDIAIPGTLVIAPKNIKIYPNMSAVSVLGARQFTDVLVNKYNLNQEYGEDLWAQAIGSRLRFGNLRSSESGMMLGMNRMFGQMRLGGALSYGNASTSDKNAGNSGSSENIRTALYASRQWGNVLYAGALSYSREIGSTHRMVDPSLGLVNSKQRARGLVLDLKAGFPIALNSFDMVPYLGLKYSNFHAKASVERGLDVHNLTIGANQFSGTQVQIGSVFKRSANLAKSSSAFSFNVGFSRELGKANRAMVVTSSNGYNFSTGYSMLPKNLLVIGGQFEFYPTKSSTISLNGQLGVGSRQYFQSALNLTFRYMFK